MSATRRGGIRESLDRYYTPPDLARVLVDQLGIGPGLAICEPSAGGGAFVEALAATKPARLVAVDVDPSAPGLTMGTASVCADFLDLEWSTRCQFDWIVGNPPYRDALAHVLHALEQGGRVAFLLRIGFLESAKRAPFWADHPCRRIWALSERPSFTSDGKTDAAAYALFYWDNQYSGPTRLDVLSWKSDQMATATSTGLPVVGRAHASRACQACGTRLIPTKEKADNYFAGLECPLVQCDKWRVPVTVEEDLACP